jgi:hypothetical protein
MELNFFLNMNIGRQAHHTWKHGRHLEHLAGMHFNRDLYQLEHFFVIIIYNNELCQVERIEAFRTGDMLMTFYEQVDLGPLFR